MNFGRYHSGRHAQALLTLCSQIEKDAALARRFQPIQVNEPSVQDCISILRGIKERYELHHNGVRITDAALVAAAVYSNRYISDRFLPDKAIDRKLPEPLFAAVMLIICSYR